MSLQFVSHECEPPPCKRIRSTFCTITGCSGEASDRGVAAVAWYAQKCFPCSVRLESLIDLGIFREILQYLPCDHRLTWGSWSVNVLQIAKSLAFASQLLYSRAATIKETFFNEGSELLDQMCQWLPLTVPLRARLHVSVYWMVSLSDLNQAYIEYYATHVENLDIVVPAMSLGVVRLLRRWTFKFLALGASCYNRIQILFPYGLYCFRRHGQLRFKKLLIVAIPSPLLHVIQELHYHFGADVFVNYRNLIWDAAAAADALALR